MNLHRENNIVLGLVLFLVACIGAGIMYLIYPFLETPQPSNVTLCSPCHESKPWIESKTDVDLHDLRKKRGRIPGIKRADHSTARAKAAEVGQ